MLFAASGLLLASCGLYNKYERPEVNTQGLVRDTLSLTDTLAVNDTTSFGNLPWRSVFTDPQLQALIQQGLDNNVDLLNAALSVKMVEAQLACAKLAFLPSIALTPQGTLSSFDGSKTTKSYQLPISASWNVDLFGNILSQKRSAQMQLLQAKDYQLAVKTNIITGVANLYYTLLMLDAQLAISQEAETSWKESARSTRALMAAGQANEAAVSQMEAAALSVSASVLDLKEQINQVKNSLSLLLAETPHDFQRGTLDGLQLPEQLATGIPVDLLSRRPDVRAAERSLEQAFYATNQARASFYPSVVLSGSAGWTNSAGGYIVNPGKFIASAVGSLTQPLFARGQLTGQLKIAKAKQEEARLSFEQTLLNAGVEVNEALEQYQTARSKSLLFDQQVEALQKAYRSTSLLMEHGTTTYLEVLTAQQSLLNAQLTQVANRFAEIQGVVNLYSALGGGAE